MDIVSLLIGLAIGLAAGAAVAYFFASAKAQRGAEPLRAAALKGQEAEARVEEIQSKLTGIEAQLASSQAEVLNLSTAKATSEEAARILRDELADAKKQLAQHHERTMREKDEESKIVAELTPVSESLKKMEQSLHELEEKRVRHEETLGDTMRRLQSTTDSLAGTLTKSQDRGRWGEIQLEKILESGGLIEGVNFEKQGASSEHKIDASNRALPDIVVLLPGKRTLPIDAKVPFASYDKAMEIPLSSGREDLLRRDVFLGEHAQALRNHVKQLSSKAYWNNLKGSPDFVLAFIPTDAILSAAIDVDPTIVEDAFKQSVLLATPVTLYAVVMSVAYAWQQHEAAESAQEIAQVGQELLSRMSTLAKHSVNLGRGLSSAADSYNKFASSLERNLVTQAQKLQVLDTTKEVLSPPQIEFTPHTFTKPELSPVNEDQLIESSNKRGEVTKD